MDFPLSAPYRTSMPNRRLLTRAAFIEELQQHSATRWPAIWGATRTHIEACLQTAYVELERLLAIPEMHRTRLKKEMRQVLRLIAEEGPEGLARFRGRERGMVLRPDERCWRKTRPTPQ